MHDDVPVGAQQNEVMELALHLTEEVEWHHVVYVDEVVPKPPVCAFEVERASFAGDTPVLLA